MDYDVILYVLANFNSTSANAPLLRVITTINMSI